MYYRKYFSGSIESNTIYRTVQSIANNSNISDYYIQTDVICSAIRSTFEDLDIPCVYNEETCVLQIEGVSLQVYCSTSSGNISYAANGLSLGTQASSYDPFSTKNYKFYVTLKGDKDGILQIFVGQYSNPSIESYGIMIGKGIDLRDGQNVRVVRGSLINTANANGFYILKNDEIIPEYKKEIPFGYKLTAINELNDTGKEITLVECVAQVGRFKLNNCYYGHGNLTANEFYNIGGDIYYYISQNILVKCASE